jgi:hypothetical protein
LAKDYLTVREHFAAMAMQGLLADIPDRSDSQLPFVAPQAVLVADALIAALNDPICDRCKQTKADGHYDDVGNLCPREERWLSEQH